MTPVPMSLLYISIWPLQLSTDNILLGRTLPVKWPLTFSGLWVWKLVEQMPSHFTATRAVWTHLHLRTAKAKRRTAFATMDIFKKTKRNNQTTWFLTRLKEMIHFTVSGLWCVCSNPQYQDSARCSAKLRASQALCLLWEARSRSQSSGLVW